MPLPIKPFLLSAITSLCLLLPAPVVAEGAVTAPTVAAPTATVPLHRVSKGPSPRITNGIGVYDARIDLFRDADGDGYYSTIAIGFDADALNGGYADVFAEISAVDTYGTRWPLLTTSVFRIIGDRNSDARYFDVSLGELVPGSYTLRVDLFDACCYSLIDTLETASAGRVRLEGLYQDSDACCSDDAYGYTYVSEETYGGALGGSVVFAALALAGWRRRRTPKG